MGGQLFIGAADAELYKYSELIPDPPIFAEVAPDSDSVLVGHPYTRHLTLVQGAEPITWSVVQGPPGTLVRARIREALEHDLSAEVVDVLG